MRRLTALKKKVDTKVNIGRKCPLSVNSATKENFHMDYVQDPIQRLHLRATELSGVSFDAAHAVDEDAMGERVNEIVLTHLSERFYSKVLRDPDDWFRELFASPYDELVFNQCEYLHQRIGGSTFYSQRQGLPSLIRRHSNVEVSRRTADKWIDYMAEALEELEVEGEIAKKDCDVLLDHLKFTASFLVAAQESQVLSVKLGCQDTPPQELAAEIEKKF